MTDRDDRTEDRIFAEEQERLTEVFALICRKEEENRGRQSGLRDEVMREKRALREDLSLNFDSAQTAQETYAEFEVLNRVIDSYNIESDILRHEEARLARLKKSPYFARISIRRGKSREVRDLYIGIEGLMDDDHRRLIVDWRAPVAELYYNQENGPTSYTVDGRTIQADLLLRRQLQIRGGTLLSWFDTTIPIEDPMLIRSLSRSRSAKMQDITATIQKEQNAVIRYQDVGALLVRGIAGSGKTSVLLQRIAYLFFKKRTSLKPNEVCLMTLNPVFRRYIRHVLPGMGESNPRTLIWKEFLDLAGTGGDAADTGCGEDFIDFEEKMTEYEPDPQDFRPVFNGETRVFSAGQVQALFSNNDRFPMGPRRMQVVRDLLEEILFEREEKKVRGSENKKRKTVEASFSEALSQIRSYGFVRTGRMGERILGRKDLTAAERAAARILLTGMKDTTVIYVMIDEIQDYSAAQLMAVRGWFSGARFMLLGDENQAIREGCVSMDQVRRIFGHTRPPHELTLMTSYRSSPEITALFTGLMEETDAVRVTSVHRPGDKPKILPCGDRKTWIDCLTKTMEEFREEEGLTGIILARRGTGDRIVSLLGDRAPLFLTESGSLPSAGTVMMELSLAKGLEFDRVILADADGKAYPDTVLGRHRLYTALSRATHRLAVLSEGQLTPLLAKN